MNMLSNKKYPKWLKKTILFILSIIFLYVIYFFLPIDSYPIFKSIKILTLLWLIWLTLYNLLSALIIITSNNNQKDISIFKYYPKFIKTRLIYLMKIRQYEGVNLFILLYLKTTLYSFFLFLLLIFIFSLI